MTDVRWRHRSSERLPVVAGEVRTRLLEPDPLYIRDRGLQRYHIRF